MPKLFIKQCIKDRHGIPTLYYNDVKGKIIDINNFGMDKHGWLWTLREHMVLDDYKYKLLKKLGIKDA